MESNRKSIGVSENIDPNTSSPGSKIPCSPSITKSAMKASKSAQKSPNPADFGSKITSSPSIANSAKKSSKSASSPSPLQKKIRQRKFVVAKRNPKSKKESNDSSKASQLVACKCGKGGGRKCSCVAYESLRASHEEFFKSLRSVGCEETDMHIGAENGSNELEDGNSNKDTVDGYCNLELSNAHKVIGEMGVKRSRDELLGDGGERENVAVAQHSSGKVMNLVQAFEKLLKIPNGTEEEEDHKRGFKLEFSSQRDCPSSSFHPSVCVLTRESLGMCSQGSLSFDSSHGRTSSQISEGRKSRRNSSESFGVASRRHQKRRQLKPTFQKPFNLRTEQRGRYKEEEFHNKLKQMEEEDKKNRIPIAQGLPWTTEEPECLVKPPVKESTRAIDLILHSDVRALDRAKFDHKVAEKLSFIEQQKMERERLQKLEEEEEIRRLRKELVPKAQPLPYFDRPFIPRRSEKALTFPQEPKFHIPQHKKIKCCNVSEQGFQFRGSWLQFDGNSY
ncbi:hypothetical protein DM860_008546 [Cuscuta australis]|uniref:TPX2 C-terminal domain-containing protein n=1 Tax=Cuscuta australis TaxID=267555 RepID=A0A328D8P0_9ASTE|nr:hypothetical protein DM860_008546 [Cuscuta australis]